MNLAQINVGRLLHPIDDPRTADFANNLDAINALAESSPGFVWRLKDETGNATAISVFDDASIILNMSVWESVEALHAFAYKTAHRSFVQRRKEWFELFDAPYLALWWVEEGAMPDAAEGRRRLTHLQRVGPSPYAFTFRKLFEPNTDGPLVDLDETDGGEGVRTRLCG